MQCPVTLKLFMEKSLPFLPSIVGYSGVFAGQTTGASPLFFRRGTCSAKNMAN